jgi:hypothetical protein
MAKRAAKTTKKVIKSTKKAVKTPPKTIYKTFSDKKQFNNFLKTVKKAPKNQKFELKYRDDTGKLKKFRFGAKRSEVLNRAKTYVKSHGNERKFIKNKISRLKKASLVTITLNVKTEDGWKLRYVRKIHDPERNVEDSLESFMDIISDIESSYDIEEYIIVNIAHENL